jgi:hypothetical protein
MIPMILSENDSVSLYFTGLMRFESWTGARWRTSNIEVKRKSLRRLKV